MGALALVSPWILENDLLLKNAVEISVRGYKESNRAVLEQGARSYLQRIVASHGAFAVLHGAKREPFLPKHRSVTLVHLDKIWRLAYIYSRAAKPAKHYLDSITQNHQAGKIEFELVHKCLRI